ncbi:BTB/POZ domain-containing protein Btb2 [Schizosaccharomyces cryophilus OY26]|uniref:BTB/POZ domain-containing protein Btb2 n=1 Tax=Schizosaccharomyces cryophilus (strain OY26 / ATCC MYA-4695 / CBS 11777 / NBRC 106824 / NRRL Y48691) TaxID=653667 RepID=S9W1I4_SCHCR|nr:BTB/POZ domain-containing protein Btb2 [Schizosaccharomyces cryophilus OY26]EPY53843.1 BTB/POZ domain-containing protein Btb2 [Schizosaccharomyces cryophilus OY26]
MNGFMPVTSPNGATKEQEVTSTNLALNISDFVFSNGFLQGAFSDTNIQIQDNVYRLHALFLARSPVLYQKITEVSSTGMPYNIKLEIEDHYVTKESIIFVLSSLYRDAVIIPADLNPCCILATSALLGLDGLAFEAASRIENSINPFTMENILTFLDPKLEGFERLKVGTYPRYTTGLFDKALEVMYTTLVNHWNKEYVNVLCKLPFPVIKNLLESNKLTVGTSSMARYKLATEIVRMRNSYRKQFRIEGRGDESVVLAFGEGNRSIQLVKSASGPESRRKTLWKAASTEQI